jgi:aryl-alcohol dehydrogenase-like predicted oxidoreductase
LKHSLITSIGLEISKISLGTLVIKDKIETINLFNYAFENGINHFDTSDGYLNGEAEKILGEFIQNHKRENILIGTKAYFEKENNKLQKGLSKKNIFHSVENSLKKLNTDYIDFFYCHRFDENTPIQETLEAIQILINQGKILHWGVCGFSVYQLCKTYFTAKEKLIVAPKIAQYPYNLFNRSIELDLSSALKELNIQVLGYYPLAQGILTGKYNDGIPLNSRASIETLKTQMWDFNNSKIEKSSKLKSLAKELNTNSVTLALNWCLSNSNVKSLITSASNFNQLNEIISFENFLFTNEIKFEIEKIFDNAPVNQYTGIKY